MQIRFDCRGRAIKADSGAADSTVTLFGRKADYIKNGG